ncbi:hypothetical protein A2419_01050 [Candidatus Adlerbacteria bacterium RIFOXYC1_FULL_48_26]|uniref:Glycosyl transferase family 1 domain-containing protein n=1 Tax=Candidatus Adlerbacteria bacterium RIFOXYC1_FULL_48_26 TaxID=1797247 RepID=A0A1F4Y6N5_9BACT|nr:MAG: hypothetical protein A2419_01050 [Candidatus Adlerbacteria bacterium RIFOXYC1_FULL_48_26]OGC94220.1 MAG: hypothetical protein A2389_03180 [Candidatus Adlerbacteria bacterium RIFOXYB1_FULL_48_10]
MKIGLLLHPYGEEHPSGLGRAVLALATATMQAAPEHSYSVYVQDDSVPLVVPGVSFKIRSLKGKPIWRAKRQVFDPTPDLYIFFTPVIPLLFKPKRSIVVAHDFAYLSFRHGSFSAWLNRTLLFFMHRRSMRMADMVIAVSEETRQAVIKYFGISPEKVSVIYNGYIALPDPEAIDIPEHYFLYPGTLKPRKNIPNILRAFASFKKKHVGNFSLLITGTTKGAYYAELRSLVEELGIEQSVRFTGYVSDGQLSYLYQRARALVFPSLLEGFGMPVLEAMAAGVPVITSNTGALAEVAGDAALLVDPHDPEAISDAMVRVVEDSALHAVLIAKGRARASEFSWEKAGATYSQVLQDIFKR